MRKAVEGLFASSGVILNGVERNEESLQGKEEMLRLTSDLPKRPQHDAASALVVIDGKFIIPSFPVEQEAVIGGDNKVLSIAAASIVAKVYRDELMQKHHEEYPMYNFAKHKGYGTLHHRNMILQHGLSPLHRVSFCGNII
jgi:ribonuclease HII